jgi:hypothetical protein
MAREGGVVSTSDTAERWLRLGAPEVVPADVHRALRELYDEVVEECRDLLADRRALSIMCRVYAERVRHLEAELARVRAAGAREGR